MAVISSGGPNVPPPDDLDEIYIENSSEALTDEFLTDRFPKENMSVTSTDIVNIPTKPVSVGYFWSISSMIERRGREPDPQMIWSGIKPGTFGYMFGPAKTAKTILCENLGISIAAGMTSFLGMPINFSGSGKVLFISMEEHWTNRTERNIKQLAAHPSLDIVNLPYMVVGDNFPYSMLTEDSWRILQSTIVNSGAEIVIIDSLTRLIRGEIEKSKDSSQVSQRLKELTNSLGVTSIVIHHSSKLNDSPLELATMAGSRVIGQEADFILGLNKLANGTRYFKEVATRYKQEDEWVTTFTIENNLWLKKLKTVKEESLFTRTDHRLNEGSFDLVLDAIRELEGQLGEVKRKDVVSHIIPQLGSSRIYEIIRDLVRNGQLSSTGNGVIAISEGQE